MRWWLRSKVFCSTVLVAVTAGCGGGQGSPDPAVTARETTAQASPSARVGDVRPGLRALEKSFRGRIGAFALDTGTGATIGYRAGERFGMASTFKAMAAAAALARARTSDPGLLDRVISFDRGDLASYSPVTQKHTGEGMTVAELCEAAVVDSDNTAANLLLGQIGGPEGLTRFFRSVGDRRSRLDRTEPGLNQWRPGAVRDTTTPEAMGRSLLAVTLGKALTAPDQARLIGWLRADAPSKRDRIRAAVPSGWKVGDKTGTPGVYGGVHDIAVLWPPQRAPLIIAIYTYRTDPAATPDPELVARTAEELLRALGAS